MTVITRFAPSPTGFLHIGGARTALFNYLFAHHHGGQFLLRIEDTDKARSTQAAIDAICDGMQWLGLTPAAPAVMQSANVARHCDIAQQLLDTGHAYRCYMSADELVDERQKATAKGETYRYDRRWRDTEIPAPAHGSFSIRLKAPLEGQITLDDGVQGNVSIACDELDDMVLLRADGTPTYLLAVVVDDHDMGITHIIRGDDHFTNSFRQALIYQALGWDVPTMAHIPLIYGADGAKLSKRHGALGVSAYRDMGFLPEAMRNYLLRLGWSHGDDEIISDADATDWFDMDGLGKSPSRFDMDKLTHVNAHYLHQLELDELYTLSLPFVEQVKGEGGLTHRDKQRYHDALPELQQRANTLQHLADSSLFLFRLPKNYTPKAQKLIEAHQPLLHDILPVLSGISHWTAVTIQEACEAYGVEQGLKLGKIMNPLRAAITGSHASPSMFHVMPILGQESCLQRIQSALHDKREANAS